MRCATSGGEKPARWLRESAWAARCLLRSAAVGVSGCVCACIRQRRGTHISGSRRQPTWQSLAGWLQAERETTHAQRGNLPCQLFVAGHRRLNGDCTAAAAAAFVRPSRCEGCGVRSCSLLRERFRAEAPARGVCSGARTVDLRGVATALDANAQVHDGEALAAEQQDGLENLVAQQIGLHQLNRASVDLHQAAALLAVRDSDSALLATEGLHRLLLSRGVRSVRGERRGEASRGVPVQA